MALPPQVSDRMRSRIPDILRFLRANGPVILAFAGVLVLAFAQGIFGPWQLSPTNLMYLVTPWSSLGIQTSGVTLGDPSDQVLTSLYSVYFSDDSLSLWDPYVGLGAASEIFRLMYPLELLYYLFPEAWETIVTVAKVVLALISMYLFLRSYGLRRAAATVGGVLYACSSSMVVWLFWPHTYVVSIAPFALLACKRLFEQPCVRRTCWLALAIALMLLGGMPTYAAYFMYLIGAYMVFLSIKHRSAGWRGLLRFWGLFVLACLVGALISLPYTYQVLASVGSNGYAESRSSQGTATFEFFYLRTLILPYERDGFAQDVQEATLYTGLLPLLLVFFFFARQRAKKRSDNLFWCAAWLITLLLLFTHVLDPVFTRLPLVSTSLKTRIVTLSNMEMSVLSAVALDDILRDREAYRAKPVLVGLGLATPACVIVVVTCCFASDALTVTVVGVLTAVMVLTLSSILFVSWKRFRAVALVVLVAACGYDAGTFMSGFLPWISADASVIPEATDTISYLQENTTNQERYLRLGDLWMFYTNTNAYYGLRTIGSHDLVNTNEDLQSYLSAIWADAYATPTFVYYVDIDSYPLLRYAGVRFLVSASADEEFEGYDLVYAGDDGLFVYETDEFASWVYLAESVNVLDSADAVLEAMVEEYVAGTAFLDGSALDSALELEDAALSASEYVEVLDCGSDSITLEVTVETARLLVLSDYYDDDWSVYVDGEKADLLTANYLFRGVVIEEAGTHTVEFRYEPTTTYALFALSGVTLVGTLATGVGLAVHTRRRRSKEGVVAA